MQSSERHAVIEEAEKRESILTRLINSRVFPYVIINFKTLFLPSFISIMTDDINIEINSCVIGIIRNTSSH